MSGNEAREWANFSEQSNLKNKEKQEDKSPLITQNVYTTMAIQNTFTPNPFFSIKYVRIKAMSINKFH